MADASATLLVALIALLAAQADGTGRRKNMVSRLASRATDAVTDAVDPDLVIEKVDVDAIVRRVDVDALAQRIDVDALAQRIDLDTLLAGVDVDALVQRIDADALVRSVDINQLLKEVDVDALLESADVNRLLDRVDANRLLDRVDPDRLLDRVDVNALMDRVDVDALMERVDVEAVVERAGIPEIVRESTGHVAGSVLDVGRRQVVGIDQLVGRVAYRITGRDPRTRPEAPPELVTPEAKDKLGRADVTGHYAGPLSRLAAAAIDLGVIVGVYTLISAGVAFIARFIFNAELTTDPLRTGIYAAIAYGMWAFLYDWIGPALTGRTVGKRVVGVRIVERDGGTLRGRSAFWRAIFRPLSFLAAGLGFLGIIISPERRALHDAMAKTVVVYDWGARSASMSAPLTAWLDRHDVLPAMPEEPS